LVSITLELLLDLVEKICVILVIAYLISRTRFFHEILDKKFTIKNMTLFILVFGALSIFGSYSGIVIDDTMGNVRDLGPIIAGLVGGPIAGVGAGLIGGLYRYFFIGGFTTIPCSMATVLAGLFAGVVYLLNKGKFIGIWKAVLFAVAIESFHMGMVLLLARPYSEAVAVISEISLPMILSNALGVLIFSYFINNLTKERETSKERDKFHDELERKKYELEIAHEIQESFLPHEMPQLSGYDIYAVNIPAKEVGGDFYDFIPLSEGKLGITIADVSGKSVPAALFMAVSRTILRAKATGHSHPALVIKEANELIASDSKSGMFVTLFYAILDLKKKTMDYVNAGHNPPVLFVRKTGYLECLSTNGIALGALDEIHPDEKKIKLEDGDVIVFYTDGVTEAVNRDGELFGEKRIYQLVKNNNTLNAKDLVFKIKDSVIEFSENQAQFDDITLMVLKVGY
jgi:sigma-B regulation protein RsbU (phosphoserine phosphatase)